MKTTQNVIGLWVNLSRAYEIASLGDFTIELSYDKELYPEATDDFKIIKGAYPANLFSNKGELSIEIYKPNYSSQTISGSFKDINKRVKIAKKYATPEKYKNETSCFSLFKVAIDRLNLSLPQQQTIKNVAAIIAKLSGSDYIKIEHLAEAIQYRSIDYSDKNTEVLSSNIKTFGPAIDNPILTVNEDKLTIDIINQVRNYLNAKEKEL